MLEPLRRDTVATIRRHPGPDVGAQLLSSYNLAIVLPSGNEIRVGRFSGNVMPQIRIMTDKGPPVLLSIGAFSEFAAGSIVFIGGEHRNASLFNYCFGPAHALRTFIPAEEADLGAPLQSRGNTIGTGVTVSAGATILDGSFIGHGAVIGANALVKGSIAPCSIVAGVPGRVVRPRFSPEREALYRGLDLEHVRAHDMVKVPRLSRDLETGVISLDEFKASLEFMPDIPTVHLKAVIAHPSALYLLGDEMRYSVGGSWIEDADALARLDRYFGRIWTQSEEYVWSPDVFHRLGLS